MSVNLVYFLFAAENISGFVSEEPLLLSPNLQNFSLEQPFGETRPNVRSYGSFVELKLCF